MIFIKNLKKETKFKFLRFLFFSICVIMNLCLLTEAKSNYNYYNIILPKKIDGIESVQYYVNNSPCGSTDGISSIKLKQDTKLKFSVKFEKNKYNKLKFKDLKLRQNNNIIKFNLYKKDENDNVILYEPDQNEYINTNQEYISSEININSDCNFCFNKLRQDIYNIKIKSNLDNINNINLKYRIINQENINNYGDFKTDYIHDYDLNIFKIPDLTPDCTLELIIIPDDSYSKSNFNIFYNNKKISSNNNIFKITEINSDGEILIDNLEKNKYTINSDTEKINIKNVILNHGDNYEFDCVNNVPDDYYVTVNNIIIKPDQNNMYKIHNITEDLNINFTKKSDAEHRICFDNILKYYDVTDTNNNSISYLNVKDNQEARFNLTPKPDYSDNITTNEIFSETIYNFDDNSHKISFDSGSYVIKNVTSSLNLYSNDVPKNKYFVKIAGNLSNLSFYNLVVNNTNVFDGTREIIVEYGDTVDLNFDVIDGYDCSDCYITTHPVLESITGSDGSFILSNINSNLYININNIKKIINGDVITVRSTPVINHESFYQEYYDTYYADKNIREEIFENSLANQFSNFFNNNLNFDIFKTVSKLESITDSDVQKAQELYENSEEYQEFLKEQEELKLEEKIKQKEDFTEKEYEDSIQNNENNIDDEKIASAAEIAYAGNDPDDMNWKNFHTNNGINTSDAFDCYWITGRNPSNGKWYQSSNWSDSTYVEKMSHGGQNTNGEGDHYVRLKDNGDNRDYLIVPKYGYRFESISVSDRTVKPIHEWYGVSRDSLSEGLKDAWVMYRIKNNDVVSSKLIGSMHFNIPGWYASDTMDVYHVRYAQVYGKEWYKCSFAENYNAGNLGQLDYCSNSNRDDRFFLSERDTRNSAIYLVMPKSDRGFSLSSSDGTVKKINDFYDKKMSDIGQGLEYGWVMKGITNNDKINVTRTSVKWSEDIDDIFDVYYLLNNNNSDETKWYTKTVTELENMYKNYKKHGFMPRENFNSYYTNLRPSYDDGCVYVLVPKDENTGFFLSSNDVNLCHISMYSNGVDMTKITDSRLKNAWIMTGVGHDDYVTVKSGNEIFKVTVDGTAALMENKTYNCYIDQQDYEMTTTDHNYTRKSHPNIMQFKNMGSKDNLTATFYLPKKVEYYTESGGKILSYGYRFTTNFATNDNDSSKKIQISKDFSKNGEPNKRYIQDSHACFDLFNINTSNDDDISIDLYSSLSDSIKAKLDIGGNEMEFKEADLEYGANYACFDWSQKELDSFVSTALTSGKTIPDDLFFHRVEKNFGNYYDTEKLSFTISPLSKTFWQASSLSLKCGEENKIAVSTYDKGSWKNGKSEIMTVEGPYIGINTMTITINKSKYLKHIGEQIKAGKNSYNDYKNLRLVFVYGECKIPNDDTESNKYLQIRYTSDTMMEKPVVITEATVTDGNNSIQISKTEDLKSFYTEKYGSETNFIDNITKGDLLNGGNKVYILIQAKSNYQRSGDTYTFSANDIKVKHSKTDSSDGGDTFITLNNEYIEGMVLEIDPQQLAYWTILDINNTWLDMKSVDLTFESSPGTEFYENGICESNGTYKTGNIGLNYTEKELEQMGYVSNKSVQSLGFKNNLEKLSLGKEIKDTESNEFGKIDGSSIVKKTEVGTIDDSGIITDKSGNIVGKIDSSNIVNIDGIEVGKIEDGTIKLYESKYIYKAMPFIIAKSDDRYTDNFKIMLTDLNGNSIVQKDIYDAESMENTKTKKDISNDFKDKNLKGYNGSFNLFNISPENSNNVKKDETVGKYYYDGVYYNYDRDPNGNRKFYFNKKQMVGAEINFNKSLYLRVIRERVSTKIKFQTDHEGVEIIDSQTNEIISDEKDCTGATLSFNIVPEEGYEMPADMQVYLENANGDLRSVPEINGRYVLVEPEENSTVILKYTPVKKEYDVFFTEYDGVEYKDSASTNIYSGSAKVKYGEDFSCCVDLDRLSAYSDVDLNALTVGVVSETHSKEIPVKKTDENETINLAQPYLSKNGNIYTIHNISDNYRILVNGLEVNKYTVTFKEHEGVVYMDQYGLEALKNNVTENIEDEKIKIEVVHDGSVGFKVVPSDDSGIDENSIVVWCVSKQNGVDVANRLYQSGDGTYFINNITTNYEVYIEDVKKTTNTINFRPAEGVTYLSSNGEVINSTVTVSYGESLEFSLLIADDYNKSDPKVYIKGIDTPLTKTGNIKDSKYVLENIKKDLTIEVLNVSKNTYTVSFENVEGVEYKTIKNKKIEESIEAEYDGSLQFKITLLDAYDKSSPSVILNDTELLAEVNGIYTINKITGDVKITVENITKNPEELTMEDILSIPEAVNSESDVNQVVSATKSYDNLSDEDKLFVTNSGVLEKAQEASKDINHSSNGVSVTGVDWNLKLIVSDLNNDQEVKENLNSEIDRKELISLYDIKLINLMTNEEHEIPYGQEISVTIPAVDTTGYENIVVVHENSAGSIEYLNADIGTDTILFKTSSFSKFGLAGKKIPNYTENPSDVSISVSGLVEDEEELKTLLGDNLSSQLGELINLDNSTDSVANSTKKYSSSSSLSEYDDTWFTKLYKWAANNELLAVLIVLLFGTIIILLMIVLGRKKNNSDD